MYYYIFDPPVGAKEFERTARIKELLSTLGIAGEMTQPQPGKDVEALVNIAMSKRYSTVVAVGGVELVNTIARALVPHENVVFGIIPTVEHPDIASLIGVSDWKSAAEQLKRRHWHQVRLGVINEQIHFITPVSCNFESPTHCTVKAKKFSAEGLFSRATFSSKQFDGQTELEIVLDAEVTPVKRGLFGMRRTLSPAQTKFHTKQASFSSDIPTDVLIAGTKVDTTPFTIAVREEPIKLIVGRGSSAHNEEE